MRNSVWFQAEQCFEKFYVVPGTVLLCCSSTIIIIIIIIMGLESVSASEESSGTYYYYFTRLTSVISAHMRVRRSPHDATHPLLSVDCHPWPRPHILHIPIQPHSPSHHWPALSCSKTYSNQIVIQSVGEVLIPFIGPSLHGMINASALETGPGFHSACGIFCRLKACYTFIIHRLSEPKQLCMNGLLKTTTPTATARN